MRVKSIIKLLNITIILIFVTGQLTYGQNNQLKKVNQYGDTITIIGKFTPSISDAYKVTFNPTADQSASEVSMEELEYSINSKKLSTTLELEPLKYATIEGEPLEKLYRNYIKTGFGNYTTPYFDFFITPKRNTETQFGLNIKHISSSGKVDKNYANSAYSQNSIGLFAKKFNRHSTISGIMNYKRNVIHYYGFKPDEIPFSFSDDDIKQRYQLLTGNAKIESNHPDNDEFNYEIGINPYFFNNKDETSEVNLNLYSKLEKGIELIDDKITVAGLNTDVNYYLNNDSTGNSNNGIAQINPYLNLNFGQYLLKIGFRTSFEIDTNSNINLFPDLQAQLRVVPGYLTAFAGFTGKMHKTGFKYLADRNPFISSMVPLKYTKNKYEIYGGIIGNINKIIDFTIRISNKSVENLPLFISDTISNIPSDFTVIYDDGSITSANIEIGYQYAEKIKIQLAFYLNNYSMENEEKAWHRPGIKTNLEANYNMSDRFLVKVAIIGQDLQYAKVHKNNTLVEKEIKAFVDLNLGVEFRYTPTLSFFVDLNNITGQQYQQWYNYPSQKLNFLGGLSYSF